MVWYGAGRASLSSLAAEDLAGGGRVGAVAVGEAATGRKVEDGLEGAGADDETPDEPD